MGNGNQLGKCFTKPGKRLQMTTLLFSTKAFLTCLIVFSQLGSAMDIPDNHTSNKHRPDVIKHGQREPRATSQSQNSSCGLSSSFVCFCYPHTDSRKNPTVDCSHRNVSVVPPGIPSCTINLDMSHNSLQNLSSGVFQRLSLLEKLDLSNNDIVFFGTGIFLGLYGLRTLLLNDNPFNLSPGAFAGGVFEPLSNLTYLNLKSRARSHHLHGQYPDVALGQLQSLETLLITGFSSTSFGAGVKNMVNLKTLDLSGSPYLTSLSKDTFKHFKNITIKSLNLRFCDLRWIDQETFLNLPFIDNIDYSFNEKLNIYGFANSTFGLQNSTIRKISLERVYTKDYIVTISGNDVKYLQNTQLEVIELQNNNIGDLGKDVTDSLPLSLKVVDISWNRMQMSYAQILDYSRLENLEVFNISYQVIHLYRMTGGAFQARKRREDTTGFERDEPLTGDAKDKETPKFGQFILQLPPKLRVVDTSHTFKLTLPIPHLTVINSSIQSVNCSYNVLDPWEGPVFGLETLVHLDLSGNTCKFVSPHFFGYMTGLIRLRIGNNRLGPKLSDFTFQNLSSLRYLDMECNRLEDVGPNLFSSLSDLRSLNLSGNYLSDWNANISGLRHLVVLDLSNNKFTSLPQRLLGDLDYLQESRPFDVDIHGNQFKCSCQTKDFVHWFTETKVHFKHFESTFCTLPNGTRLSLSKNKVIWKYLNSSCRSYTVFVVCFAIFLAIVCGSLIYRYRWKLRYLYYKATHRRERTGYQRLDTATEEPYGFDAFISYEDSDRAFITEHIIPRLEGEAGLKLCIDKRDFIPGLYVTDNIMNAIQNSKKTVVLLSRQFLKSKWCMYELNMARMESIYNDRELLIVVLLEKIPSSVLAAEVLEVMYDKTYIERTGDEFGDALFWEKLTDAIISDS